MFRSKISTALCFSFLASSIATAATDWMLVPERIAPLQDIDWQQLPERQFAQVADYFSLADGQWTSPDSDGFQEWNLRLRSINAVNLNLGFKGLQLPASAQISLRSADAADNALGPYSAADVTTEVLYTPIVQGEELWLSLRVLVAERSQVRWQTATVQHGFRSLDGQQSASGVPTQRATGCGTNTQCPQANPWRNQVSATLQLTVSGTTLCTGTLLTDTAQSLTPYVLTADHCGSSTGPVTDGGNTDRPQNGPYFDSSDASSTVAYWNFEALNCGSSNSAPATQSVSGGFLRAANSFIDFALIELASPPPASYNAYWSGWDARGTGSNSGVTIHHANGDEKEIAFYTTQLSKQSPIPATYAARDYWRVLWSEGVTAQGSSGSGLWDSLGRLVGNLSRGLSSCSNPSGADFYGAFDQAWNGNPAANRQLAAWLDRSGSGVLAMNGRNSSSTASAVSDSGAGTLPPSSGSSSSGSSSRSGGGGAMFVLLAFFILLRFTLPKR